MQAITASKLLTIAKITDLVWEYNLIKMTTYTTKKGDKSKILSFRLDVEVIRKLNKLKKHYKYLTVKGIIAKLIEDDYSNLNK